MEGQLLDLVACPQPGCAGRLAARLGGEELGCRRCEARYPLLGGVPVLVPDPAGFLAAYRDALLASLAEAGCASRRSVALVDAYAAAAGAVEARRFGDDWTAAEAAAPMDPALAAFVAAARGRGPMPTLLELLPARVRVGVEVGAGDGALARALLGRCERLLVVDLSLRAVLRAVRGAGRGAKVAGLVADAEHLPLRAGAVDLLVAAHLTDLLESPGAFFAGAARALRRGGRLALSVPRPEGLDAQLAEAGLVTRAERDAVPWLRLHDARHVQVYLTRVLVASRRGEGAPRARGVSQRA